MELNDPNAGIFPGIEGDRSEWGDCGCCTCVNKRLIEKDGHSMFTPFIVCPECGNKRCPKATFHEYECTGSNEPGQKGSRFEGPGITQARAVREEVDDV